MSEVLNAVALERLGEPFSGQCPVGLGVKQDQPSAVGQDSTPGAQGLMGTTGPQVTFEALYMAEDGVITSSPVGSKQGVATPPLVGVK